MECLSDDTAFAFAQRRLSPEQQDAVEKHLVGCEACQVLVSELVKFLVEEREDAGAEEDAAAEGPALPLSAGAQVGRYVIRKPIGAGGGGVVYEAFDPELGRRVGLKLLRP